MKARTDAPYDADDDAEHDYIAALAARKPASPPASPRWRGPGSIAGDLCGWGKVEPYRRVRRDLCEQAAEAMAKQTGARVREIREAYLAARGDPADLRPDALLAALLRDLGGGR